MVFYPGNPRPRLPTDEGFPLTERFPRQMLFSFQPNDHAEMEIHLEHADPNPFPGGPIDNYHNTGKRQGFAFGRIGDPLTSQTFNPDDPYELHDALHLGLLTATSGWSPVLRRLLGIRRRSNNELKTIADGLRAAMAEEEILSAYARELIKDGPIPKTLGSFSVEAAAKVSNFLPPGTAIPAETWADGLRLGGTLMFMLELLGAKEAPVSVRVDLDAKDMYIFPDKRDYETGHTGASIRKFSKLLTPKPGLLERQYGTFMGTDAEGRDWYLPLD